MKKHRQTFDSIESTAAAIKAVGNELQKKGERISQSIDQLNLRLSLKDALPDCNVAFKAGEEVSQQMKRMNQYVSETTALFSPENMKAHLRRSMNKYNKPVFRPNE